MSAQICSACFNEIQHEELAKCGACDDFFCGSCIGRHGCEEEKPADNPWPFFHRKVANGCHCNCHGGRSVAHVMACCQTACIEYRIGNKAHPRKVMELTCPKCAEEAKRREIARSYTTHDHEEYC
jgi:hypothetical protein